MRSRGTSQKEKTKENFAVTVSGAGYSTPPGVSRLCVDALGSGLRSAYAMAAVNSDESESLPSGVGIKSSDKREGRAESKQDTGSHDIVSLLQSVEEMFEKTCSAWADCRVESERLQDAIDMRLAANVPKDRGESDQDDAKLTLRAHHLKRLTGAGRHPGSGSPSSVVSDAGSVRVVEEQILV